MSFGEVAEWSIAAVLKTVELRGSGGSNPSLSARPQSKKVSRNRYLLFLYLWCKFTRRRRCENKRGRRAAFCAVGLQGSLRRAEGKGVERSDHRERSSQFAPFRGWGCKHKFARNRSREARARVSFYLLPIF